MIFEADTCWHRLRSHTRQQQANAPGAVGQQRGTTRGREGDIW